MNLLFLGTWSVNDPLSRSTIIPHLDILKRDERFSRIIYCSLERMPSSSTGLSQNSRFLHLPFFTKSKFGWLQNALAYVKYFQYLGAIIEGYKVETILCRGSLAGSLGYKLWKKFGVDFYVESFEPHAKYMLEAGAWFKWDPRFVLQRFYEMKQRRHAKGLMPVSMNYQEVLLKDGIKENRVRVLPCTVDTDFFNPTGSVIKIRERLGFTKEQIIGIYVGKFGDIYLDNLAFSVFQKSSQYFGERFRLIILSPQDRTEIIKKAAAYLLPDQVTVFYAEPEALKNYLFISDFSYCTVRPGHSSRFCCPVKNGEYWSMGLPIIITKGIGDDSDLIHKYQAGVVIEEFKEPHLTACFKKLDKILKDPLHKTKIRKLALKYRSRENITKVYSHFFRKSQH